MDEYLEDIYYNTDHAVGFTSADKLYRWLQENGVYKPTRKYIKTWLKGVETYALHREVKRKFPRNRVYVSAIDEQWDADLMDMTNISKYNRNFKYVLVCIDVLSRFAWAVSLKTKKGPEVMHAFETVFAGGRKPLRLRTDKGTEFTNKVTEGFLKSVNVLHMKTQTTEIKACYAERLIKTLKARIYRYFTHKQTYKYVDKLNDVVSGYNNTYHRSIKRKPSQVTAENQDQVWFEQYAEPLINSPGRKINAKYTVGTLVRISHVRGIFDREYSQRWTGELFRIVDVMTRNRIPMYKLQDYAGEDIKGYFYAQELQEAVIDEERPYRIHKILKTRKKAGVTHYFVSWVDWPAKYNQWVSETQMESI